MSDLDRRMETTPEFDLSTNLPDGTMVDPKDPPPQPPTSTEEGKVDPISKE